MRKEVAEIENYEVKKQSNEIDRNQPCQETKLRKSEQVSIYLVFVMIMCTQIHT